MVLDRVVRWNLDLDGDLYGDERERYRWYEGIATAASLQWLAIPWAAAIMVWPLGKPAVLPLAVVLVLLYVPTLLSTVYVRRRRVDTAPRSWNAKRVFLTLASGTPAAVFLIGSLYVYDPQGATWRGAAFGGVFGALAGLVAQVVETRRRRRREAALALAGDDD
ncbi:hypothetical protein Ade02nite_05570 [Paractinoplanes deccanensis]|uniref:DUF2029 domain-containing protein n=1 Tax=Paractinoplanes deccanensis TaxID=113561 RepID=A0ABQ3XW11_9ACTN|nr:hypothetical protein [Actinoplanes deccanensis]GID71916.1 hypothetical protein Ade02nite_05570 [Actinoplanes deccanensis]